MDLAEWTVHYVRHRDLIKKNLKGFEIKENLVEFQFKDKKHDYVINESLEKDIKFNSKADLVTIVCSGTEKNLKTMISNWDKLSKDKTLNIIFVRPETNQKLIISPHIHSMIADPDSLETGLKSMFDQAMSE